MRRLCLIALLAVLVAGGPGVARGQDGYSFVGTTLIQDVRVIDGLGTPPVEHQDILVQDGRIAAIGRTGGVDLPSGVQVIGGLGLTAIPGLIDMHIHLAGGWANGAIPGKKYEPTYDDASIRLTLAAYLYAGVTTVLDMGNDHAWIVPTRDRVNRGELLGPRVFTTGAPFSQYPTGWEAMSHTDYEDMHYGSGRSMKVGNPSELPPVIDRYSRDGIEIILLYTGLSPHAARFVVKAAHERGILTVANFWTLNMDKMIMQATGLDGWATSAGFDVIDYESNKWMAVNDKFVVVSANVGEDLSGLRVKEDGNRKSFLSDPLVVNMWGPEEVEDFYKKYPLVRENFYEGPESFCQVMGFGDMSRFRRDFLRNIKGAHDAGVLIAGGSGTPYPSVWPGEGMHRELELLVMAGIPELDVIRICTYNAARILRREREFGSLRPGLVADLMLVEGDPSQEISSTRNIRYLFKEGRLVDRRYLRRARERAKLTGRATQDR